MMMSVMLVIMTMIMLMIMMPMKVVGTHTSYTSCCLFPGSDNQVGQNIIFFVVIVIRIMVMVL